MIVAECIQHRQTPAERIGWSHKAEAVGILWRGVWAQVSSKAEYAGVETRIGRNALTVHSLFVLQSKIHPILEQPAGRGSVILKRHWNMIMDLQRYGRKEIVRNQSGDVAGQYPDRDTLIALASIYCQYELFLFFPIRLSFKDWACATESTCTWMKSLVNVTWFPCRLTQMYTPGMNPQMYINVQWGGKESPQNSQDKDGPQKNQSCSHLCANSAASDHKPLSWASQMKKIHQGHAKKCWAQTPSLLSSGNDLLDIEHCGLFAGANGEQVSQD